MMERKHDGYQRSQMVPQTGTKSMVQNPPTKINGVDSPSCGVESYENGNLTSCIPHWEQINNRQSSHEDQRCGNMNL